MPILLCTLWRQHIGKLSFCGYAKVSHFKSLLWCANLAALFCMWSRAFICPSLYGSQQDNAYSRIGQTSDVQTKLLVLLFPFFKYTYCKAKCPPGFFHCVIDLICPTKISSLITALPLQFFVYGPAGILLSRQLPSDSFLRLQFF
jgi:hypothetical protein